MKTTHLPVNKRATSHTSGAMSTATTAARATLALTAAARLALASAAALLVMFAAALVGAPHALAHDHVVKQDPAPGARLAEAPKEITMVFSGNLQPIGHEIKVLDVDGKNVAQGDAKLDGTTIEQPLQEHLKPGTYSVDWRVVSNDGHPVDDSFSFTVTGSSESGSVTNNEPSVGSPAPLATEGQASSSQGANGSAQASTPSENQAQGSTEQAKSSSGAGPVLWVVIGAIVVILIIVLIVLGARAKRNRI